MLCNLHHLATARFYCERIVALHHGRVVFDGTPAQLTGERVHAIYGVSEDAFDTMTGTAAA